MDIKIYTSTGCFYCTQVKELCKRAEVEYNEIVIGEDIARKDFNEEHPNCDGFPWVIIDGQTVGGLIPTAKYFLKEGFVSARKD